DGISAKEIAELAVSLVGGQTQRLRRSGARILDAIFLLTGPHTVGKPYRVEYRMPNSATRRVSIAAVSSKARTARYLAMSAGLAPYVDLGVDAGVARIAYNAC